MSDSRPETRRHTAQQRASRAIDEIRDESLGLSQPDESVGLSQLTVGIGDCATEFATGSVRVVGGLLTDLVGIVLGPVDRLIGSGAYSRTRARRSGRYGDYGVSRAIDKAMTGTVDTVTRSQGRFRDAVGPIAGSENPMDDTSHPGVVDRVTPPAS